MVRMSSSVCFPAIESRAGVGSEISRSAKTGILIAKPRCFPSLQVVISPRNYFLFSPLLPSVTVGTLEARSIIQPTRFITRHKKRKVAVYEAKATDVDPIKKTVTFEGGSWLLIVRSQTKLNCGQVVALSPLNEISCLFEPFSTSIDITEVSPSAQVTIPYDYLVYAVGADNQTFGIKGVKEYGCFLKELKDADKIRRKLLDCIETAAFVGQTPEEIDRLMHMVVVGGGPTGVEYAGELHDFLIVSGSDRLAVKVIS